MGKRTGDLGKRKALMAEATDEVYVGLDVHRNSTHVAILKNGVQIGSQVMPPAPEHLVSGLELLRPGLKKIVYEAGPTGFGLYRALRRDGLPVEVVAPGKIPQVPGREAKCDRLDCRKLALYASKDMLRTVSVPTEQEEGDRQVVRLRNQLVDKRRAVKQQIRSFLMLHSIPSPQGLNQWTGKSVAALHQLKLLPELRFTMGILLEELAALNVIVQRVEKEIARISREERHARAVEIMQSHPGVGRTVAMEFETEIYRPERFETSRQVANYIGLAPLTRSSGETRRSGGTSKLGRARLRSMLIEAAWMWVKYAPEARVVYGRLARNTGSGKKAIVALARRMAINLWVMRLRGERYRRAA